MATANTLTGVIPVIYQALQTVARERIGAINAVAINAESDQVAVGQTLRVPVAGAATINAITPGAYAPQNGAQTISYADIAISNSSEVSIPWSGEEQKAVGGQYTGILTRQFEQAFRAHSNAIDTAINTSVRSNASRAYGTPGTAPFGTANDLSDLATLNQILDVNGAPLGDRHYVMDSRAKSNLAAKQPLLFRVNESGTSDLLRNNVIDQLEGFGLHVSNHLNKTTKGTLSAGTVTGAIGDTTLTISGGTGSIVAGDVISFAGDANLYTVLSATGTAPTTSVTISAPGLINAVSSAAVTVSNTFTAGWGAYRNAIQLLARAPIMPAGGDAATDVTLVLDPVSGLQYQIALYRQYRQQVIEVAIAYGVKVIHPEFVAINMS